MSRLIDADKLMADIEKSKNENPHTDSKVASNHYYEHLHFASLINKQPTAYDIDKVVRKLDLLIMDEECKLIGSSKHAFKETLKKRECYKNAREIVKAGGIDES